LKLTEPETEEQASKNKLEEMKKEYAKLKCPHP
jgi:hypothetical protein